MLKMPVGKFLERSATIIMTSAIVGLASGWITTNAFDIEGARFTFGLWVGIAVFVTTLPYVVFPNREWVDIWIEGGLFFGALNGIFFVSLGLFGMLKGADPLWGVAVLSGFIFVEAAFTTLTKYDQYLTEKSRLEQAEAEEMVKKKRKMSRNKKKTKSVTKHKGKKQSNKR